MLTEISFKNFKAWRDTGRLRLAPLTVFFGTNSAGKSSIQQLLLMLKQTAESPDRTRVLHLGDERSLLDLGAFRDVLHQGERKLSLSLQWDLPRGLFITDPLSGQKERGNDLRFWCEIDEGADERPQVSSFRYSLLDSGSKDDPLPELIGTGMARRPKRSRKDTIEYDLEATGIDLKRQPGRAWPLPRPSRFYGFPDEAIAYYQNTGYTADLVLELERALKSVYYLGPLREYPKRLYLWSGEVPDHVGQRGERAVEALLGAGDRSFNWVAKQKTQSLQAVVASRLQQMGMLHEFTVKRLGKNRKEYEVLVRTRVGGPLVKLTDVGFGVSQVLPVLVEAFYVPPGSTVILEQPEIHLHPRVQSLLADVMVDAITAREARHPRNVQLIVESHSEHFLRRLMRLLAEEYRGLSPDQLALYFVEGTGEGAKARELDVDLFGNIRNWPKDFFGDEMDDLVARAKAQAKRTRERAR